MAFINAFALLWFGNTQLSDQLVIFSSIIIVALSFKSSSIGKSIFIFIFLLGAVAGTYLDAYEYYSKEHSPGNYYAWPIRALYVVALISILGLSIREYFESANK